MTGPKRTPAQREADLETVARLYLQKQTQAEIGQRLGLSRQQITYDLKTIQRRWQESAVSSFEARKAEELARIDHLEREYWDAWNRSYGQMQVTTKTAEEGGQEGQEGQKGKKRKATVRTEDLAGDPRFLLGVQWCIQKRVEILGLDAPVKHEDTTLDSAERVKRLADLLRGLRGVIDGARERAVPVLSDGSDPRG